MNWFLKFSHCFWFDSTNRANTLVWCCPSSVKYWDSWLWSWKYKFLDLRNKRADFFLFLFLLMRNWCIGPRLWARSSESTPKSEASASQTLSPSKYFLLPINSFIDAKSVLPIEKTKMERRNIHPSRRVKIGKKVRDWDAYLLPCYVDRIRAFWYA